MDATASGFDMMGVPAPTASAWFAGIVELAGGALLIVGLAVPVVGLLLLLDMLGALFTVHLDSGIFAAEGGYELVLILGISSLLLAVIGPVVTASTRWWRRSWRRVREPRDFLNPHQ